jgi:pimeloyl-ACP methyl ester carboxylesterase
LRSLDLASDGIYRKVAEPRSTYLNRISTEFRDVDTGAVADLLAAAVAGAGVSRFTLVGHDVGTWVAYAWATRQPQGIERLCLTEAAPPGLMPDSAFGIANAPRVFQFYFNAVEELPELLTRGREREFLGWLFRTKSVVQGAITAADLDEYVRRYSAPGRMSAGFEYYRAVPTSAQQNIRASAPCMSILALGGEGSLGDKLYLSLKAKSQHLEGGSMSGIGHYIPEEAPGAFVERLLRFIKG